MPQETRELEPGSPLAITPIAAAPINADGSYEVSIGADIDLGGRRLMVEVLDETGHLAGASIAPPPQDVAASRDVTDENPSSLPSDADQASSAESPDGIAEVFVDVTATPVPPSPSLSLDADGSLQDLDGTTATRAVATTFGSRNPPSDPCGANTSCCRWYHDGYTYPWTVVATGGTNTRYADVSASFTNGFSSELGWALKVEGGGWSASGGADEVTGTSIEQHFAPSNAYGLYTFEIPAEYRKGLKWCWTTRARNGWPIPGKDVRLASEAVRAEGFVAGSRKRQWFGELEYFPGFCREQAKGKFALTTSEARRYGGGVDFGFIRVSSKTNYSTRSRVVWDFDRNGKYICGETAPAGSSAREAGKIMADWRNR